MIDRTTPHTIDRNTFALWMGVLADRFGRELKPPTLRVYYELLSEEVDTDAFVRGCKLVIRRESFFPSPQQIIDAGLGQSDLALEALRAFRAIADGHYPHEDEIAREAMRLCDVWDTLRDMSVGTRASKERQFIETYGTLVRQRQAADARDQLQWPSAKQIAAMTPAGLESGQDGGRV